MRVRRGDGDRVLELDGATRGHDRGGEQGRDVRGPGAHCADPGHGRSATRSGPGGERAAGRPAPCATEAEDVGKDSERAKGGNDRRKPSAHAPQLVAEIAAAGAVAHVPPRRGVRA